MQETGKHQVDTTYSHRLYYEPRANATRLKWDLDTRPKSKVYEELYHHRPSRLIPEGFFQPHIKTWVDVGAGTGTFAESMGKLFPDQKGIAIERCRMRGKRLESRVDRAGLKNVLGLRGNVISLFFREIPDSSLDRIFILYPCPWPKNSQRKNRWYLHPLMSHMMRALKPLGQIVWASDQSFYIEEAQWICEHQFKMQVLSSGALKPHSQNDLALFPKGRSKFEMSFLQTGQPCYELIVQKSC